MPDRVVYLVDKQTKITKASDLEYITDAKLSELLVEGYSIASSTPRKAGGVPCIMMVLKSAADERAVAVREPDDIEPPRRRQLSHPATRDVPTTVTVHDEFGAAREISMQQAMIETMGKIGRGMTNLGEHPGHLGAPGQHNLPGMTIVSGYSIGRAYDLGMIAAKSGQPADSNPWPGTSAGTKWLQGYRAGEKDADALPPAAATECYNDGYHTAQSLGKDDDATCPYQSPAKKRAWLEGFRAGGGVVE